MGACYYVKLKVKVKDEKGAVSALNEHIKNDKRANYSLDDYAKEGATTETFGGLMRIFLAGREELDIGKVDGFTIYENEFDASYGWESVMMEMFDTLAPYLEDGSEFLIYPDSDYDKLIVQNGKSVQVH
jgi:hypothetical protein